MKRSEAKYRGLNGKYLREAGALLAEGDYVQASEKLWGAFAEIVKSVAAQRNRFLGHHRSVGQYVDELHSEHPGVQLRDAYYAANLLHINFYQDNLTPAQVLDLAEKVRVGVRSLRRISAV